VEVNATIPGAFHHLSPAIVVSFSAYPLSAVLQYIFIILFTFIDLFHKVHSHHTFTFLGLPQFLASIVIFTNWGKQGVTLSKFSPNLRSTLSVFSPVPRGDAIA
jgi:hypothetical protein